MNRCVVFSRQPLSVNRAVGEGGAGGAFAPPVFWKIYLFSYKFNLKHVQIRVIYSASAPQFLGRPPSFNQAPTALMYIRPFHYSENAGGVRPVESYV